MYILFAILIFGFLIFIHELGHFMTAKLLGVQVNEFSICMGPALLQRTRGETTYSLRLIPIGGYCAMEGEDEDSDNPRAFTRAKTWRRLDYSRRRCVYEFPGGLSRRAHPAQLGRRLFDAGHRRFLRRLRPGIPGRPAGRG